MRRIDSVNDPFRSHVLDYVNANVWAILPETLERIHSILISYYSGEKSAEERIEEAEKALGRKLDNRENGEPIIKEVKGKKVQVIPVHGVIAKRMNMFSRISGGVSTEELKAQIEGAINNEEVDGIVLDVESPGGALDSIPEVSNFIYSKRGVKPIVTHANGMMASGGLYIGSAADAVTSYESAEVGSLGVLWKHVDMSRLYEERGVKNTIIRSKKFKAVPNPYEPITDDVRAMMQEYVDGAYKMFVRDMAKFRGKDMEMVAKEWGSGKMFPAGQAMQMGMIDKLANLDESIMMAADMVDIRKKFPTYSFAADTTNYSKWTIGSPFDWTNWTEVLGNGTGTITIATIDKEEKIMTVQELKEKYPEIYASVYAEGKVEGLAEVQTVQGNMTTQVTEREQEIATLKAENETLKTENAELNKTISIAKKNAADTVAQSEADAISAELLGASAVEENLHAKVREMPSVSVSKFRTEDGGFDKAAYRTAFEAEVKDWEAKLSKKEPNLGLGDAQDIDISVSTVGKLAAQKEEWKKKLGYN